MNMKWIYAIGTICTASMMISCQPTSQKADNTLTVINIESAAAKQTELKVSELGSNIRYLPLETTDSCLIGNKPKIKIIENRILVLSNNTVYCFDKETGNFLNTIGHTGDDPQGYSSNLPSYNKSDGMLYFNRQPDQLQRYDMKGIYHGKVTIATPPSIPSSFAFLDTLLVGHYHNIAQLNKHNRALAFFTKNGMLIDTISSVLPTLPSMEVSDIASINVFMLGNAGTIISKFKDGTSSIGILNPTSLWEQDGELRFKEAFNDTIYNVSATKKLEPWAVFHLGEYGIKYKERWSEDESDGKLIPIFLLESKQKLFFQCAEGLSKTLNGIYDKSSGTTHMNKEENGFTDDINGFMDFKPNTCSEKGEYAQMVEAADVINFFDENPEEKKNKAFATLLNIGEDDNPVVVLVY